MHRRWEGPVCSAESLARKERVRCAFVHGTWLELKGRERAVEWETTGDFTFRNKCFVEIDHLQTLPLRLSN